jgi:hypothetical protein
LPVRTVRRPKRLKQGGLSFWQAKAVHPLGKVDQGCLGFLPDLLAGHVVEIVTQVTKYKDLGLCKK